MGMSVNISLFKKNVTLDLFFYLIMILYVYFSAVFLDRSEQCIAG